MQNYKIEVPITANSLAEAAQVANERLTYNEDYGFPYQLGQSVVKHFNGVAPVTADATTKSAMSVKKAAILVGMTYFVANVIRKRRETNRLLREQPNDPEALRIKKNREETQKLVTTLKTAIKETRDEIREELRKEKNDETIIVDENGDTPPTK